MELVFFLFLLLVAWPFTKGVFLFFADREEWRRGRERKHAQEMSDRRRGLFGRLFGG